MWSPGQKTSQVQMCSLVHGILTLFLARSHSLLILLNGCSMLFRVWVTGLHTVLLSHSLKTQGEYMWIQSTERMLWPQVLSLWSSVLLLLPKITSPSTFPGIGRPSTLPFSGAAFTATVFTGPSWGNLIQSMFWVFTHAKMIATPSLLPSKISLRGEIRHV